MAEVQTHTQAGEMTQIFIEFVMQQAQNAALFLGQMPDPRRGRAEVNLPLAKMFIDQLIVIRSKTRGNLNPDEKKVIESAVSELQMVYAETAQMVKAQNIHAEVPEPLMVVDEAASPASAAPPPPVDVPAPPPAAPAPLAAVPAPAAPPAPTEPGADEQPRKRFTKSYGP